MDARRKGLALQEQIERKLPYQSVVFVSGQGNVPTSVRAMKAGAVDVAGLVNPRDLCAAVL
jgi:FixJ family two-component response regulator